MRGLLESAIAETSEEAALADIHADLGYVEILGGHLRIRLGARATRDRARRTGGCPRVADGRPPLHGGSGVHARSRHGGAALARGLDRGTDRGPAPVLVPACERGEHARRAADVVGRPRRRSSDPRAHLPRPGRPWSLHDPVGDARPPLRARKPGRRLRTRARVRRGARRDHRRGGLRPGAGLGLVGPSTGRNPSRAHRACSARCDRGARARRATRRPVAT